MLLRPLNPQNYLVVGACAVRGLMNGESLLGTIPSPWQAVVQYIGPSGPSDQFGVDCLLFRNAATSETTLQDPRLPPLSPEWEITRNFDLHSHLSSRYFLYYKNTQSGEIIDRDPRLLSKALVDRGIDVKVFQLT